jgi:EamA-like transporter family
MTAISSAAFLAPAAAGLPRQVPPVTSLLALVTLGIVNTGLAYWLFYLLIDEAGAATASVITYVMPVVALVLGVGLLGERFTIGAVAGMVLIMLGAWLATSRQTSGDSRARGQRAPGGRRGGQRRRTGTSGYLREGLLQAWEAGNQVVDAGDRENTQHGSAADDYRKDCRSARSWPCSPKPGTTPPHLGK